MPSDYVRKECQQFLFLFHTTSDYSVVDIFYFFGGKLPIVCYCFVVMYYNLPGPLHIVVTSFLVLWLSRTTKIIFYVCLLTHFARQDRQNGNLKNIQNHATK